MTNWLKEHIRHMVGGHSVVERRAPAAFHFSPTARRADEVPEPDAVWLNICCSTTETSVPTMAAHPVGSQVPCRPITDMFQEFLDTLGYPHVEETDNPVYRRSES
jgi:threonine dehydratase